MPGESDDLLGDLKEWIPSQSLMLSSDFVRRIGLRNECEFHVVGHYGVLRCGPAAWQRELGRPHRKARICLIPVFTNAANIHRSINSSVCHCIKMSDT